MPSIMTWVLLMQTTPQAGFLAWMATMNVRLLTSMALGKRLYRFGKQPTLALCPPSMLITQGPDVLAPLK